MNSSVAVVGAASTLISLVFAVRPAGAIASTTPAYSRLSNLLSSGQWRAADIETTQLLLQLVNREQIRDIRVQDINQLSCESLSTIDGLWRNASNGNLGFSVQSQVYQSFGGTREYDAEIAEATSLEVGWRQEYLDPNYTFWMDQADAYEDITGREFKSFPPGFPASEEEAMRVAKVSYEDRFTSPMRRGVLPTGIGLANSAYPDNVWLGTGLWQGNTAGDLAVFDPSEKMEHGGLGNFLIRVNDCGL